MSWLIDSSPLRVARLARETVQDPMAAAEYGPMFLSAGMEVLKKPHQSHPDFGHLCLLVFEAVLEVCVVAAPGYILARHGGFSAEQQSYLSKINIAVFTPCLIFSKLASQLTAEKLIELAIIPLIFAVQTLVSWACSMLVGRLIFRFDKRPRNFVTAMAVRHDKIFLKIEKANHIRCLVIPTPSPSPSSSPSPRPYPASTGTRYQAIMTTKWVRAGSCTFSSSSSLVRLLDGVGVITSF